MDQPTCPTHHIEDHVVRTGLVVSTHVVTAASRNTSTSYGADVTVSARLFPSGSASCTSGKATTVPNEAHQNLVVFHELLDGSDGVTDVTAAQTPGPERTGAVLAKRWQQRQRIGDGVSHRCHVAAGF